MSRKRSTGRKKQATRWKRWLRWTGIAAGAFVVASVLLVLPLRWFDPATTMFMLLDDSGREPLLHEWVAWDDISTAAKLAVVAAEDQRFADHFGLDLAAIRKAVDEKNRRGYLRGASTITQQTVKNLYLWPGRSFVRKGLEAWLTLLIEVCLPKRRILEIYLNVAEFGPGIYGIGAASKHYFRRPPSSLSDYQAALLAAVLPSPRRYRVHEPSDFMRERSDWILTQMYRLRREAWLTRIEP
ncbi:MAG: monofunctional biosynthetic peptidoglycan transglycosylase [Woeseiaceae bacterium]|nr:monofunctional biosynthetic peptidoglycan transglycosylase [Woeseiaceae bacterium]